MGYIGQRLKVILWDILGKNYGIHGLKIVGYIWKTMGYTSLLDILSKN